MELESKAQARHTAGHRRPYKNQLISAVWSHGIDAHVQQDKQVIEDKTSCPSLHIWSHKMYSSTLAVIDNPSVVHP